MNPLLSCALSRFHASVPRIPWITSCPRSVQAGLFSRNHSSSQYRDPISLTVLLIKLVSEFMQDYIVAIEGVGSAASHRIPGQQDYSMLPRLTCRNMGRALGEASAWINPN